ncbi:DUF5990 family protein [Streptomyces sp. NPDC057638]|uniref:DUF5990 family protein n=1 Tax=Streptomyces sp. NPDC057638 TaxID=3346190 RepID=UPI0036A3B128
MAWLTLRITGRELPGATCGDWRDVHVGTQRGREPEQLVRADADHARFEIPVETVTAADGARDFRGPHVQGRRGARFIYLTWGELPSGGAFAMFRRAKLFLDDLPDVRGVGAGADAVATTELALTDPQGLPLCAAIRPPLVTWRLTAA